VRPSSRLERIPPYLFAELERKIAEKRAAGIDVISLGIGDPDTPTYPQIVAAAQAAIADPGTHQYPSNRGRSEFREAVARFYARRFGVELDPETEVMPAIGAKECIFNLNLAFLDPTDVTLASDPGYPVYTAGPILAGAEPVVMPLLPELGFTPDLDALSADVLRRARLMFFNYPNNPTGATVPDGFFERIVELAAANEILAVHDNAYSETTYDGYVAPSFLATPGAKDTGVEVFSWSKGYNMTGWRCAAIVGNPAGRRRGARFRGGRRGDGDEPRVRATARSRLRRTRPDWRQRHQTEGHDLHLGAGPRGVRELGSLLRACARAGSGRDLTWRRLRAEWGGLLPHLADHAGRPPARGRGAPARVVGEPSAAL
jgi:histidinol-phosphate/aromatic aminotransferase/cobyric acid decarboxylase-like protein